MTAKLLCGRTASRSLLGELRNEYDRLRHQQSFRPSLHIIRANDRADTDIYIRRKLAVLAGLGFAVQVHDQGALRRADIAALISRLNAMRDCHGILVQSPVELGLGPAIPVVELAGLIDPQKDVDGLNPINMGRLASRAVAPPLHLPCTPQGVISLLRHYSLDGVAGSRAVVLGRSDIVGMPMSFLLNRLNATVTLCHSQTKDLPAIVGQADLLIAAIGRPGLVRGHWIRPGAIVVDVGISRILGQSQPVGDVEFEEAQRRASAITPVPGGVGPMTVAMLARNLFVAALRAENVSEEEILSSSGDAMRGKDLTAEQEQSLPEPQVHK